MNLVKHYKNTDTQWGWVIIVLHWLLVLPIIGLFVLGLYMMDLGYYDDMYILAPQIHEAIGIIILALMLFRLCWRLFSTTPKPPATNSKLINLASHLAHNAIYLVLFAILITGLMISFAGGQGLQIFDWFIIPGPAEFFDNQATFAGDIHELAAFGLIALVILHAVAALKHHYIDKDTTLTNMLGIKEK